MGDLQEERTRCGPALDFAQRRALGGRGRDEALAIDGVIDKPDSRGRGAGEPDEIVGDTLRAGNDEGVRALKAPALESVEGGLPPDPGDR